MPGFAFFRLQRSDFPMLAAWLATPHVARWWNDDPAQVEHDYGGCIDGSEPCSVFIARHDDVPVGLIQRYRFGAYPAYAAEMAHILTVADNITSIDYLIGPAAALQRGLGSAMLRAFAARTWQDDRATPAIVVPVQADNRASWRSLELAGFTRIASGPLAPDNPRDRPDHFIYRLARPA